MGFLYFCLFLFWEGDLSGLVSSKLSGSVVLCLTLNFEKLSVIISSNIAPIHYVYVSYYPSVIHFIVVLQFLGILVCCFFPPSLFFRLLFNFRTLFWHVIKLRDFSSAVSSLLINLIKSLSSLTVLDL